MAWTEWQPWLPWVWLAATTVGAWFTFNVFRPMRWPAPMAGVSFFAGWLTAELAGIDGIETPEINEGDTHTFWKYCLRVDGAQLPGGAVALAARLKPRGIACAPRYIQKPAFQCEIFVKQRTFGNSRFPFNLARPDAVDYRREKFPGTFEGLEQILVLPWSERYTEEHVQFVAQSIREAVEEVRTAG